MFDNVLVGVDDRSGDDDAVALARQVAAPAARATLANIYGTPATNSGVALAPRGSLADVAPTILTLLRIAVPRR